MTRAEALQLASQAELDLVEVSPMAEPPVVRVMDYGKFLFEQNKKAHSAKRKQKQIHVKAVSYTHLDVYKRQVRKMCASSCVKARTRMSPCKAPEGS